MYSPASGRARCGRLARREAVCQVAATMNEPSSLAVSSPRTPLGRRASSIPPESRMLAMVKVEGPAAMAWRTNERSKKARLVHQRPDRLCPGGVGKLLVPGPESLQHRVGDGVGDAV